MSEDTQECIDRLAAIFGHCLVDPSGAHLWNIDSRKCEHCNESYPYDDGKRHETIRAAAPEMLAILCELVNPDDFDQHPQDFADVWHRARAIISKAEGFT